MSFQVGFISELFVVAIAAIGSSSFCFFTCALLVGSSVVMTVDFVEMN